MTRHPVLLVAAAILALTACQTPFGFGGDEWEGDPDTARDLQDPSNMPEGAGAPYVLAAHAFCADGQPQGMAAIVDGPDIWITHVGFSDECTACADWSVSATPSGTDVAIAYTDADAATCDCDCAVSGIEFIMTGFSAEPWTVSAGDASVGFDLSE